MDELLRSYNSKLLTFIGNEMSVLIDLMILGSDNKYDLI